MSICPLVAAGNVFFIYGYFVVAGFENRFFNILPVKFIIATIVNFPSVISSFGAADARING